MEINLKSDSFNYPTGNIFFRKHLPDNSQKKLANFSTDKKILYYFYVYFKM